MKYEKFDKKTLKALRDEIIKQLQETGDSNLEYQIGGIKFSEGDCDIQLKVRIKGKKTMTEKMLDQMLVISNLRKKNDAGQTLVEYISRKRKYPWIMEDKNGKRFQLTDDQAKAFFAK